MKVDSRSTSVEVYTFDIDFAGHASNISYIRWLEIGRIRLLEAAGLPIARMLELGFAPFLTRTDITYRRPATLGQIITIEYDVGEVRSLSSRVDFRFTVEDVLIAEASQWNVMVNISSGRPHRLSKEHDLQFSALKRIVSPR